MRRGSSSLSVALAALVVALLHASCGQEQHRPDTLRHVVVLGASVSAGYGTAGELDASGEGVTLADLLRAMIRSQDARITDAADALFLIAPETTATEQAQQAKASKPSCVVAVDYLYWLGQGSVRSVEQGRERLTTGLRQLEGFECPVLVSELPPIPHARTSGGGARGVPDPATLDALNEAIVAWADARSNVVVVPLKDALLDLRRGEAIEVAGNRWAPPEALAEILQGDGRHPTVLGLGLIAAMCLEALLEEGLVAPSEVVLDARGAARAASNR